MSCKVHYFPLLSRPKAGCTRRVVANLSLPYGSSVNVCIENGIYDNSPYTLGYPSVENIVEAIQELNYDAMISKNDVSCAFRNL